jgi:hypothetical protein
MAFAVMAILGAGLPAAAQGQPQAVPRVGLSFPNTVTVQGWVESVNTDTRTVAFSLPDGRLLDVAVGDGVRNLDAIQDDSMAEITYNEIVTILNLRQKGPGSKLARRENNPNAPDNLAGRFTYTISAIDLTNNTVSLIDGRGGPVRTYSADTPPKQELLHKARVGDVVIGLTTPLQITAMKPSKQ